MVHQLTRDEARRIAVRAQLLDAERPSDVVEVAEQVCSIKIDPTAVIAPAEHTILWSRVGWSYEPGQLKKAVEMDHALFEFDGSFYAAGLLPLMLPWMRTRPLRDSTKEWLAANENFRDEVLARLRAEGPLLASDIPDTAAVARDDEAGWYGPNQVPRMLEFLSRTGQIAVVRREGRHRLWDIAERAYPSDLPEYEPEEAARMLDERRLQAAGIAKQRSPWTPVGDAGEPAVIEGSKRKYRVDPQALAALNEDADGRVAILSPYDGMLFDRPRLREIFDFDYILEQYKPKSQRVYGYFAHPILIGDVFMGMLDAEVDREHEVLRINAVHQVIPFEPEEDEMVRAEIADLAEWLGVRVSEF
ncbi:DNA glycosylase AlkZ-like family protein [Humibacter ginsenosidimutans]|uniref:Winged helix-turn-helix domain-containing protein n=1 Tax=Humibacter ginsenosidimutans TaxID=2599293 RepID=A0A5B8M6F3_9MICO|nr:crosslink repair DNA glycosylase YcaQ family protein [Humibacter ginsenosidimutans]QDZ15699.1 winged helix-turn-helix domain-containing protein [Humibacter ginsenosidimutans]